MSKYFITVFFLYPLFCHSQVKGDYTWELGSSSRFGQDPYPQSIELIFNNDLLTFDTLYRPVFMGYLNASISDVNGNLLLYTNGCEVRDGNHMLIQGSKYLNSGDVNNEWCVQNSYGYSVFEGGIFLPFSNDSIVDLLHQRLLILSQPTRLYVDTLFYSQFVRNENSFTLLNKAIPIIGGKLSQGNLEAIRTNDGKGWWVIQNEQNMNNYFVINLKNGIIDTIFKQQIGDTTSAKGAAQSVFSPDGKMYARFSPRDQLFLFDFDRSTGLLSNYRKIFVIDTNDYSGIAFSSNSRFLYASTTKDLFQFDVLAEDIEASKIHIGRYDGYGDPFPAKFYLMQLGPDCRIYICTTNGNKAWHVIQEPDQEGLACRFEQHAIEFPVSNSITMPNFPVFRVNTDQPCDPDIISGYKIIAEQTSGIEIYPNPTHGDLYINLGAEWALEKELFITLFDQLGHVLKYDRLAPTGESQHIDLSDLPPGVFMIEVKSLKHRFIKMGIKM